MGSSTSHQKAVEVIQQPTTVDERSSGFHILELHAPTMGFGLATIIIILLIAAFLTYIYRYVSKRCRRQPNSNNHTAYQMSRHTSPLLEAPSIIYLSDRRVSPRTLSSRVQEIDDTPDNTTASQPTSPRNLPENVTPPVRCHWVDDVTRP